VDAAMQIAAKNLGGIIRIDSKPVVGTVFTIEFKNAA
jgi:hypothetical protein